MSATDALIAREGLPADYAEVVDGHWQPLAARIAALHASSSRAGGGGAEIRGGPHGGRRLLPSDRDDRLRLHRPLVLGVNGAQGSGKTTLCRFLQVLLAERGLRTVTLSLDDLYLTRAERERLGRDLHPLFATRGVPGTHDVPLGKGVLAALGAGGAGALPRFDKAADDRSSQGTLIQPPVHVILFEGWCVGAVPQPSPDLLQPVNRLEAEEDPDGTWRREVNRRLATDYAELFGRIDGLVMLKVEGFEAVRANRRLQEDKLARRAPFGTAVMDHAALDRFIMHYERLTRWMLREMPGRADIVIPIGPDQRPA